MKCISFPFCFALNCIPLYHHITLFLNISFFKFIIIMIFISIEDVRGRFHYQLPSARPPSATCSNLPLQCALLITLYCILNSELPLHCTALKSLMQCTLHSALDIELPLQCTPLLCPEHCIAFCIALYLGLYTVFWTLHFAIFTAFWTALISKTRS